MLLLASNVIKMCNDLNKDNPHAVSPQGVVDQIQKEIQDLEEKCDDGEMSVEEKEMLVEGKEELMREAMEIAEADDGGGKEFENINYAGNQNLFKPKTEDEYASIDAKMISKLMDSDTRQIKRIANDFLNNYVSCLVQSERMDNQLTTLRGNAVKVLDNAKISISNYNNTFQRLMREDGCDVQLIGTDTDSGIYVITKNRQLGERIDQLVHRHMSELMDYSNYPPTHPFFDKRFKKNFHRFQNEHPPPSMITEAIETGPKEYLLSVINTKECKTMDGAWEKLKEFYVNLTKYSEETKEGVLKRHKGLSHRYIIKRNDYLKRIHEFEEFDASTHKNADGIGKVETYSLRSEKGKMFLLKSDKVKMSKLMDKTYIFEDGVTTCPFGHYRLQPIVDLNESVSYSEFFNEAHLKILIELERKIVSDWPLIRNRICRTINFMNKLLEICKFM